METVKLSKQEYDRIPQNTIVVKRKVKEYVIKVYEDDVLVTINYLRQKKYPYYHVKKYKDDYGFPVKENIREPAVSRYKSPPIKFEIEESDSDE